MASFICAKTVLKTKILKLLNSEVMSQLFLDMGNSFTIGLTNAIYKMHITY